MSTQDHLENLLALLTDAQAESLAMSLDNVHHPGLFSLVFAGTEPGTLTRAFIANEKINPYAIALHSHKYDLEITTIAGKIRHYRAEPDGYGEVWMDVHRYESPLTGGKGLVFDGRQAFDISEYYVPTGSVLPLRFNHIHSVSCSEGAIWIVKEKGFRIDRSIVLGVPFATGHLYAEATSQQTRIHLSDVIYSVKKLLSNYTK